MTDGQDWPVEDTTPKFNKPAIPKETGEAKIAKLETTIERLTAAVQLFLKYAPLSGDMALMIRASQSGGNEAHERANKLIEHFEHLNEAHDKGRAALNKQVQP